MPIVYSDGNRRIMQLNLSELESIALMGTSLLAACRPKECGNWLAEADSLGRFLANNGGFIVELCRADGTKLPWTAKRLSLNRSPEPYRSRVKNALLALCRFSRTKRFPDTVEIIS